MHRNAKTYSQRPSSLLAIGEPYLAWCLDQAVAWYGHWVEGMLEQKKPVRERGKITGYRPKYTLGRLLGTETPRMPTAQELRAALGG